MFWVFLHANIHILYIAFGLCTQVDSSDIYVTCEDTGQ